MCSMLGRHLGLSKDQDRKCQQLAADRCDRAEPAVTGLQSQPPHILKTGGGGGQNFTPNLEYRVTSRPARAT